MTHVLQVEHLEDGLGDWCRDGLIWKDVTMEF